MEEISTPDWPSIYHILGESARREIIHYLLDSDAPTTLADLVDAAEFDDDESRERYRARLYHVTLPVMAEASLLEWDSDSGRIELSNTAYKVPLGALSPPEVPVVARGYEQRADD